jgi:hypothetical protein
MLPSSSSVMQRTPLPLSSGNDFQRQGSSIELMVCGLYSLCEKTGNDSNNTATKADMYKVIFGMLL